MSEPCFWSALEPQPSIFCEEPLCSFVVQPANTWSNIGYLAVAIVILFSKRVTNRRVKNLFFIATFALFLGSTFFHGSGTHVGKLADVSAMFAVSMVILTLAVERRFGLREARANVFFAIGFALSLVFLFVMKFGNVLFGAEIALATIFEWQMRSVPTGLDAERIKRSIGVLLVAILFWILDATKILCDPGNHWLTGHGMWHLLTALAIWVFFSSYSARKSPAT